jgi:hypothetical protein
MTRSEHARVPVTRLDLREGATAWLDAGHTALGALL